MVFSSAFLALWACVVTLTALCAGLAVRGAPEDLSTASNISAGSMEERDANPLTLRILPLGASITWGYRSSNGNGYRKPLRDQLRFSGYEVDMVGTKQNGDMVDRDVEAHIGDVVTQVQTAAQGSFVYLPNLVLINAGTNDCLQSLDIPTVGSRMESLVNMLLDNIRDTTVVVSTLIPCKDATAEGHRPGVNDQYRALVTKMHGEGKRVVLADMDPPLTGWLSLSTDFEDDIHPNDGGYKKMAEIWWLAIKSAIDDGTVKTALDPGQNFDNKGDCTKAYGDGVYAGGLTQTGSGEDDSTYHHNSQSMGSVLTVESDYDRNQWFFARLFSRNLDDFVGWYERDDGSQWYGVWRNTGDSSNRYVKIADMNAVLSCIPRGVNFVDLNGDGLDDMVCIGPEGDAYTAINQGDGNDDNPPTFVDKGLIKDAVDGYPQAQVRVGDIDGDGRADYCVVSPNGDMNCWRNGWIEDTPAYWQDLGKRFSGRDMGNLTGVRLEDINGDGRDDWVWINDDGEAYTETNSRSCLQGKVGDGLNVAWRGSYWRDGKSGPSHPGMGVSGIRERIHFARVYGVSEAFGLLGRQDYVYLEHSKDGKKHKFNLRVWKNEGSGATKLKADGNKYCNMVGHSNGMMDYVWTLSTGKMTLYPNRGMTTVVGGGPSFWDAAVVIWDPSIWGAQYDRRDLHLVDWDGDGACDIVWVDPNNQNKPQLWRNLYKSTGKWDWEHNANPAPDLYCPESRGVGLFDIPVQFADVSGNGRGDYLCIEKDGRTWGFIHNSDGSWEYIDQFKYSEQKDRANLHWADVNGDGRADMIWTDKFNGDGWVWYNNGRKDVEGSRYEWVPAGARYMGNRAGSCMYYPDLQGDKRADMHAIVYTFYNTAETWFNECPGDAQGDDPGKIVDPHLPSYEISPADVCKLSFNSTDEQVLKDTWTNSGAEAWLKQFLDGSGAEDWSDKFFTAVIAGGDQGGSTYDCSKLHSENCPGPLSTPCTTYTPPESFYVHVQMGHLYSAYSQIWSAMVENGVNNLASVIPDIVKAYGTPPKEDNAMMLGMLVGIFATLAGISGGLGSLGTFELSEYVNPLTVLSGAFQMVASDPDGYTAHMNPDDLEKALDESYAAMFNGTITALGDIVSHTFNGTLPDNVKMSPEDWVNSCFADGSWLSKDIVDQLVSIWIQSSQQKWVEFATVRAMQTENKNRYQLLVSNEDTSCYAKKGSQVSGIPEAMTEAYCKGIEGCVWHDNHCLCFGYNNYMEPGSTRLEGDALAQLNKYIIHHEEAIINNYECVKFLIDNQDICATAMPPYTGSEANCKIEDPSTPTNDDLDLNNPLEYTKCFFNLYPVVGEHFICTYESS